MEQSPDEEQLEDRLCLALYQASHAMTAAYRKVLTPPGLTYPQYTVLSALWKSDPATIKDLGELLGSDYGTMSPLIKRLEAKALVRRTRTSTDERKVFVHLTDLGQQLGERTKGIQAEVRRATGLSEEHSERLADDLRQLTQRLHVFTDAAETGRS